MYVAKQTRAGTKYYALADIVRLTKPRASKETLTEIVQQGAALYVECRHRPAKWTAETIWAYLTAGGDPARLLLYVGDKHDIGLLRACVGPTKAVMAAFVNDLYGLLPEIDEQLYEHPAACAVEYLVTNGGDEVAAWQVVGQLADIRVAVKLSEKHGYMAPAIVDNLWNVDKPEGGFCASVGRDKLRAVERFASAARRGVVTPRKTFCELLIAAIAGNDAEKAFSGQLETGLLFKDMSSQYNDIYHGTAAAIVFALQLIVTSWAANEFHSDLFDATIFHKMTDKAGTKHASEFSKLCSGKTASND